MIFLILLLAFLAVLLVRAFLARGRKLTAPLPTVTPEEAEGYARRLSA